jgi:hypothetical protein
VLIYVFNVLLVKNIWTKKHQNQRQLLRKRIALFVIKDKFSLILPEKETGKKFWRIIIKQELI